MKITKFASLLSGGSPTEEQLAQINRYSKSPLTAEEVYCFSVRLCDDEPDRDFECFDTAALSALAELFVGKTGIVDHEWSSQNQIARIFATQVCREEGVSFLRAWCYMLRTEKHADLIADIEGGIKKEVSIGCAVGEVRCSICGSIYGECQHRKGVTYDGEICLAVLKNPTDAYEFSFVAVPAQKKAGVLKGWKGGVCLQLAEFVEKSGDPALLERYKALEKEAEFGRQCREELVEKSVSLALLLDFGGQEPVLRKAFSALSAQELRALEKGMAEKSALLFPAHSQLPSCQAAQPALDADYII